MTLNHGKVITIESYYEGTLASTKQQYEIPVLTSKQTLLRDVIDALSVISNGTTTELDINIKIDNRGRLMIKKKWVA